MVERALSQMGRKSSDHQVVIHSSIALLRERFMQLQREKEMRQRRAFLRTLWESERYITNSPTAHYEPPKLFFFQTEILKPPPCQVSLSLWPNSQIKHSNFQGTEKPPQVMKLWQPSTTTDNPFACAPPIKFNDSDPDVDTSLHL
ncbi:uncharacterized protein LOC130782263 [Actinidia eriantha]|uniref:uncharacterized protein LOC130782263 n=1 Tax=Actinidia eriantha TaxID=165200 RepID=UPI0025858A6F|nr:uncharacterized protein LOC130782263 [Actinidia eriantha]